MIPAEAVEANQHQHRMEILIEVADERARQNAKWGVQDHPNGTGRSERLFRSISSSKFGQFADKAKVVTDTHAEQGTVTYTDIFMEEVFEAVAESDPRKLRAELIQCAAVAVQWIEKLDREEATK